MVLLARQAKGSRSLTSRIYKALKQDILHCELRPGQDVYEGQLAERYGVSKTPIREALNTLRQEGYVQVMPRRGYRISPVSVQDVQHIFHVRLLLEPSAAELAAQRISGEQLAELRRLAQHRSGQSRSERMATNRPFHLAVAEASGNPRLATFIGRLLEDVERLYHLGIELNTPEVTHGASWCLAASRTRSRSPHARHGPGMRSRLQPWSLHPISNASSRGLACTCPG